MGKLRSGEFKQPAQDYTATEWWDWDWKSETHAGSHALAMVLGSGVRGGGGSDRCPLSLLGPTRAQSAPETENASCPHSESPQPRVTLWPPTYIHLCGSPHSLPSAFLTAPFHLATWRGTAGGSQTLTLQDEMMPSPPAHTIVSFTMVPHQSLRVHVA